MAIRCKKEERSYEIKQIGDELFYAVCKKCKFIITGSSHHDVEKRIILHPCSHLEEVDCDG